jgi:hypothetical protein
LRPFGPRDRASDSHIQEHETIRRVETDKGEKMTMVLAGISLFVASSLAQIPRIVMSRSPKNIDVVSEPTQGHAVATGRSSIVRAHRTGSSLSSMTASKVMPWSGWV